MHWVPWDFDQGWRVEITEPELSELLFQGLPSASLLYLFLRVPTRTVKDQITPPKRRTGEGGGRRGGSPISAILPD